MDRKQSVIIWGAILAILHVIAKLYPGWSIDDIIEDVKKK
jgi:hypothetical protein